MWGFKELLVQNGQQRSEMKGYLGTSWCGPELSQRQPHVLLAELWVTLGPS